MCRFDEDCQLNGRCTGGACDCDAAWSGEHCEALALEGAGSLAYGGPASKISSWGGGPPVFDRAKKEWVLFVRTYLPVRSACVLSLALTWLVAGCVQVTEIANHCGLAEWQHQSTVVKTISSQPQGPQGPYTREKLVIPTQAHNPYYVFDPSSQMHLICKIVTRARFPSSPSP